MARRNNQNDFRPGPHINARVHRAIMKKLKTMTPEEFFQSMVDAGIYTKTGRLRKPYRESDDTPMR